uniref:sigma-70 family RNA polymerase sigma factor n=1 Tax=Clostridium sp. NkU-1 TaxID=1095009 RepID=UPI0006CF6918
MTDYGNHVLRLAYSYLHNMSDAEDVLQDTLIQFIKTQPQFETADHEKAWVLRVAINLSKNKITYNKIRKTDELSDTLAANETEDLTFVWDAVKQLPSKYREVVHLYYYEGCSTAQVASLLSKKEATVRSLLQRARLKLKDVLKEVYDFEE